MCDRDCFLAETPKPYADSLIWAGWICGRLPLEKFKLILSVSSISLSQLLHSDLFHCQAWLLVSQTSSLSVSSEQGLACIVTSVAVPRSVFVCELKALHERVGASVEDGIQE